MPKKKPAPDLNDVAIRALADKIAHHLISDNHGRRYHRLVTEPYEGQIGGGGYSFDGLRHTIYRLLTDMEALHK